MNESPGEEKDTKRVNESEDQNAKGDGSSVNKKNRFIIEISSENVKRVVKNLILFGDSVNFNVAANEMIGALGRTKLERNGVAKDGSVRDTGTDSRQGSSDMGKKPRKNWTRAAPEGLSQKSRRNMKRTLKEMKEDENLRSGFDLEFFSAQTRAIVDWAYETHENIADFKDGIEQIPRIVKEDWNNRPPNQSFFLPQTFLAICHKATKLSPEEDDGNVKERKLKVRRHVEQVAVDVIQKDNDGFLAFVAALLGWDSVERPSHPIKKSKVDAEIEAIQINDAPESKRKQVTRPEGICRKMLKLLSQWYCRENMAAEMPTLLNHTYNTFTFTKPISHLRILQLIHMPAHCPEEFKQAMEITMQHLRNNDKSDWKEKTDEKTKQGNQAGGNLHEYQRRLEVIIMLRNKDTSSTDYLAILEENPWLNRRQIPTARWNSELLAPELLKLSTNREIMKLLASMTVWRTIFDGKTDQRNDAPEYRPKQPRTEKQERAIKNYDYVIGRLLSVEHIQKESINPFEILWCKVQYAGGRGKIGRANVMIKQRKQELKHEPLQGITNSLSKAFLCSFQTLPAFTKRILVCVDVSPTFLRAKIHETPDIPVVEVVLMILLRLWLRSEGVTPVFVGFQRPERRGGPTIQPIPLPTPENLKKYNPHVPQAARDGTKTRNFLEDKMSAMKGCSLDGCQYKDALKWARDSGDKFDGAVAIGPYFSHPTFTDPHPFPAKPRETIQEMVNEAETCKKMWGCDKFRIFMLSVFGKTEPKELEHLSKRKNLLGPELMVAAGVDSTTTEVMHKFLEGNL